VRGLEDLVDELYGKEINKTRNKNARRMQDELIREPSALQEELQLADLIHGDMGAAAVVRLKESTQQTLPAIERADAEKIERKVAFEKVSADLSRYASVVKSRNQARQLSFPLPEDVQIQKKASTASLIAHFKPSSSLEKDLQSLYQAMDVEIHKDTVRLDEVEDPEGSDVLGLEERRQLRSALYHEQIKLKHLKKIKSKKYRKRRKKILEAAMAKNPGATLSLLEGDAENAEERRLKMERERAEARMSLRQRASSKWIKKASKFARSDAGAAESIKEAQRLDQISRDRISAFKDQERAEQLSEAEADFGSESSGAVSDEEPASKKAKGVWGMSFMVKARERKERAAQELIEQLELEEQRKEQELLQKTNLTSEAHAELAPQIGLDPSLLVPSSEFDNLQAPIPPAQDEHATPEPVIPIVSTAAGTSAKSLKRKSRNVSVQIVGTSVAKATENPWMKASAIAHSSDAKAEQKEFDVKNSLESLVEAQAEDSCFILGGNSAEQKKLVKMAFSSTGQEEEDFEKEIEDEKAEAVPEKKQSDRIPGWVRISCFHL